jgi:Fe-S oxidoreductase
VGFAKTQQAFALIGVSVQSLSDGCCGMAGSFGYQHPELSFKIAQKQLLPNIALQDKTTKIVAAGSSCQQQMHDLSNRKGIHPALVFAEALNL